MTESALSYSLCSHALSGFLRVYAGARSFYDTRFRASLEERLGRADWLKPLASECIWFHGASMGEVTGLLSIISKVKSEFPNTPILITCTSETGKAEAMKQVPDATVRLLPLDIQSHIRRVIEGLTPKIVVIAETELWPNMLSELSRKNVPVVVVNGRISDFSFPNYIRLKFLVSGMLEKVQMLLVQTKKDLDRYIALGATAQKVCITGNTKYDKPSAAGVESKSQIAEQFGVDPSKQVIVFGSVRDKEELLILSAMKKLLLEHQTLQILIAPRHPERFEKLASLLASQGFAFEKRSEGKSLGSARVLLIDTLGELAKAYALSDVSFVGGSLADLGGHNPLEPAAAQVPVLMGPYYRNAKDAMEELVAHGGGKVVDDESSLVREITHYLRDSALRERAGQKAMEVWKSNIGATERVMEVLRTFLKE